ncbi:hypothetical protein CLIB1444_07S01024 [[Candida] jaroonii]|uniref:Uncharacterized protein n=1 Tax=[Candida] jaroonii TaxID=467808 RepID=A0ACA9Y9J8_9ASCO|nr:hypothetical protein CLIB1444_07S01024 [[Candida] jaroonii]
MDLSLLSAISRYSGYLSFTIWLFAQLPQIIENHLNQSVDGVNLMFLGCWIMGDLTNLIGCILTRAMTFQLLIASYYCFIDIILSFQFYYYTQIYPYHKTPHNLLQSPNMVRHQGNLSHVSPNLLKSHKPSGIISKLITTSVMTRKKARAMVVDLTNMKSSDYTRNPPSIGLGILGASLIPISNELIGQISAWACTTFYVSSRIPQIITNYKKKSTSGISPYLFMFAMLGNIFYSISLVVDLCMNYIEGGDIESLFFNRLPFLLGSGGTVLFDTIILFQCWYYQPQKLLIEPSTTYGSFQQPDWYTSNFIYEEDNNENEEFYNHSNILNDSIYNSPPHHYISRSHTSNQNQHTPYQNSHNQLTNSLKRSSIRSIPSSNSYQSPNLHTSLIPSIINSYTSVNKKMADERTPFSPSDFLSDDFHTPIENSSFSLNN